MVQVFHPQKYEGDLIEIQYVCVCVCVVQQKRKDGTIRQAQLNVRSQDLLNIVYAILWTQLEYTASEFG